MKIDYLWLLSGLSIFVLWGIGNKWWWIWAIGLFSQLGFFYMIFDRNLYGLIPAHAVYVVIYTRNLIRWHKEDVECKKPVVRSTQKRRKCYEH
jgi:integral membrane sensor domain MASE1